MFVILLAYSKKLNESRIILYITYCENCFGGKQNQLLCDLHFLILEVIWNLLHSPFSQLLLLLPLHFYSKITGMWLHNAGSTDGSWRSVSARCLLNSWVSVCSWAQFSFWHKCSAPFLWITALHNLWKYLWQILDSTQVHNSLASRSQRFCSEFIVNAHKTEVLSVFATVDAKDGLN